MVCTETILGKIVEKIVDTVFQSVGRHVGFMLHYKQNLKNLDDEENNLQEQRTNVEGKINEANRRGEAIDNDVSEAEGKVVRVKHLAEKGGNIGTVAHPKEAPPELEFPCSRDYEGFDSRDKVFEDIVEALKDPEVNRIGVYGTGGVGKTTMVTKIGELVKKDGTFDEVVIAVVSQDANVRKIQGQLADRLNLTLRGETKVGRANGLWNRLDNGKKNLIILDDVWQELDLKKIGIPITDENKSCKVVLTSRNRNMWKNMDVKEFAIKILSEEESWTLFKKKVGNYVNAHELREIAWAVCKECQGLPVVINAIGAALKGKDMYAWRDALDKLKNTMLKDIDQKVYASLKWSFDQLDSEDAKSCFLLCCLFPEDAEIQIDDLVRYYMAGRTFHRDQKPDSLERALDRVRTVVSTLKSCCLLLDENYYQDVVKMHDVVRDVAISIAKGEKYSFLVKHGVKDWPEKATYEQCSVISLRRRDMGEFPDELVCPALHTLRLDCTDDKTSWLQVPDRFFSGTENLVVLDLNSVTMLPILPASLAKLAKLQMLCLNGCKLGDIAILKDLNDHLEILSLRCSNIEVLPPEVGQLTRLRVLDMDDCDKLKVIPKGVISKLLRLEELYLPWYSFHLWEGTRADGTGRDISCVSLDELMSLTRLTTLLHVRIPDPALLPKDFTFENLVRFNILVGGKGYSHSEDSTGFLQLENIHLANPLEVCKLKYLFSPSLARGLVGLKRLEIERCMDMEGVIGNEGEEDIIPITFSLLNDLTLKSLPNLKSFYPKKEKTATSSESSSSHDAQTVAFPVIERLNIESVPKVTQIWYKQNFLIPEKETESSFNQLRSMVIQHCDKLMNVVGGCPKMESIVTEKQKGLEVDDYVTRFPKLQFLMLKDLLNLESFCSHSIRCEAQPLFDNQMAFPVLEKLFISYLPNVIDIWDKKLRPAESFCQLKNLNVWDCSKLVNLVQSTMLPQLQNLRSLGLYSCPMVEWVVDLEEREEETQEPANNTIVPIFPELTSMALNDLQNIKEVFHFDGLEVGEGQDCVGSLIQVRKIELSTLPKLICLWNKDPHGLLGLQNLEYLTIKDCPLLRNLLTASVAKALGGLKVLYLRSCSTMEEVVFATDEGHEEVIDDQEIVFPKLEWLILKDLSNLKSFCSANYNFNLPSLKRVVVKRCPNMLTFTSGSVRMPPTMFIARGDDGPVIEDLNKHLEQQHSKGDQETITDYEMCGEEDFRFLNLQRGGDL
ncbi:hypothetical protein RHGRI_009983 [Rhododendron griersonianum]|uniref:NB-ARC domain-containing protein n=1 Tax=Rhododendron griersonianum TaxID=479676 RepID=A0AAV6KHI2_9ERIC|nr:hypothetical protein RHGRI_009983 [Rhododendron griersonianum]